MPVLHKTQAPALEARDDGTITPVLHKTQAPALEAPDAGTITPVQPLATFAEWEACVERHFEHLEVLKPQLLREQPQTLRHGLWGQQRLNAPITEALEAARAVHAAATPSCGGHAAGAGATALCAGHAAEDGFCAEAVQPDALQEALENRKATSQAALATKADDKPRLPEHSTLEIASKAEEHHSGMQEWL
eukprot:NODE_21_length_2870_cov_364.129307.p6 GENE.NODE_21_length_2870_cov_364.129307~~NODE_21_length_2870_cov_364.129307.p6  ORF type:complete len:191 (-),score=44.82 NODE_21_length_2870_cov_364.129307:1439-2011(-)